MKLNLNIANLRKDTKDDTDLGLMLWKIFVLSGNLPIYLNDPEELNVTWEVPLIGIRHRIDPNKDKGFNFIFDPEVIPGDINFKNYTSIAMKGQHHRRWRKILKLLNKDNAYSLLELTHKHVIIFQEGDNSQLLIDKELANKSNLAEIEALVNEELPLIDPDEYSYFIGYEGTALNKGNTEKRIGGFVCINIEPRHLISNFGKYETHLSQYIEILLDKRHGYRPDYWKDEELEAFWIQYDKQLINEIKGLSDFPYTVEEFFNSISTQDNKQLSVVKGRVNYVKSSMYFEAQKFGKTLNRDQLELFEENKPTQDQFNKWGLKLSVTESRVINAIQKMLTETNYEGTSMPRNTYSLGKTWPLPVIYFSKSKLFDYCGVGKRETGRGKLEFNSHECEKVLNTMRELNEKQFTYLPYKRPIFLKDGKERFKKRFNVVRAKDSLFKITEGFEHLTAEEVEKVSKGEDDQETSKKIKFIGLTPSAIFLDRIDNHFVLKDDKYIEKIKQLSGPKTSKFAITFIEYLYYQAQYTGARNKTGWVIKLKLETIARHINMEGYIEKRQWTRIQKEITKYLEIAKESDYVLSYKEIESKPKSIVSFKLNKEKFAVKKQEGEEGVDYDFSGLVQ